MEAWWVPVLLVIEAVAYYVYSWIKTGQTLGMKTWRLQLVTETGGEVGFEHILRRVVLAPLSLVLAGLGYLAFYWSANEQTWHDKFSQTYVVRLPKD